MPCKSCVPYEEYRSVVNENEQLKLQLIRVKQLAGAISEQARVKSINQFAYEQENKELEMILALLEGRN